ncbi:uncharacterized protein [Dermacentor albipictus]|uniref:uncharacterized protein n=1 Tax=Dermacentor albipictus TaxID=60249 RepID=UPI0038FCA826
MPDPKRRHVHRLRDHVVAGANWRPTRFVEAVPNARVCGLCNVIPKRAVLLPCLHALCESCHASSCHGGGMRCPLDQEPFEEAECVGVDFPARKANALKVYCWNEAQGCEFVGTVEGLLRHYENECAFHSVECSRCGVGVLHRDLHAHYVASCSTDACSADTDESSSEPAGLTLHELNAALEELKSLFSDQLLPTIQSQMNEFTEHVERQGAMFAEMARQLRTSEDNLNGEMAEIEAAMIPSTLSDGLPSQPGSAGKSSASSTPGFSGKQLVLRKLEVFVDAPLGAMEDLRQMMATWRGHRQVVAHCELVGPCGDSVPHLTGVLSASRELCPEVLKFKYLLTLEQAEEIFSCTEEERKFAPVSVLHRRNTYIVLAVTKSKQTLRVDIELNGALRQGRQFFPRPLRVAVLHLGGRKSCLQKLVDERSCKRDQSSLQEHVHHAFCIDLVSLNKSDCLQEGKMMFEIELFN